MSKKVKIINGKEEVQAKIGIIETWKFPVSINWSIYIYTHKFLCWKWKTYDYVLQVPYINRSETLMSVSEINTNTMLEMIASNIEYDVKHQIEEMKLKDKN